MIEGVITSRVKGGFSVSIENVRAFLPGSLYGARLNQTEDNFQFETDPLEFKIIKLDRARNNVVISRKAVLERELTKEREELIASLEVGQVIEGVVKEFDRLRCVYQPGAESMVLLHITDLAWRRIKHPSDILTIGESVKVKVLKCDRERSRIFAGTEAID